MDDPTTTATLDQADEDILTYTASDEALELAAAGTPPPYTAPIYQACSTMMILCME
jgi:hypothetical protein